MNDLSKGWRAKSVQGSDLMLAPLVALMRLPILAREAHHPEVLPRETIRAGAEKVAAFAEGAVGAHMAYTKAMMSFWPEVMSGKTPTLFSQELAENAVNAALNPASVRVRANYRRLSRRK